MQLIAVSGCTYTNDIYYGVYIYIYIFDMHLAQASIDDRTPVK
jgi:hypothetical protein